MKRLLLSGLLGLCLSGFTCGEPPVPCEFQAGDLVRSKISGHTGQVLYTHVGPLVRCWVDVRFAATRSFTDSRILSSDGPIEVFPLATIYSMRPYELEPVER